MIGLSTQLRMFMFQNLKQQILTLINKRHRVFDGLDNGVHGRMILPLLNLKKAHMFLISTYNTMAYSSFEKYGKYTEEARNEFKKKLIRLHMHNKLTLTSGHV